MSKNRLGRGLDALFMKVDVHEDDVVNEVEISELRPNPYQPRKSFDDESMNELIQSIKQHGIIQPLVVRKNPIKGYDIIAGERRFRAAKEAGLKTVPVVVREFTDQQMMEIALIENIQREDLNPIELANAFKALMEELNITQEELADRVGKSRSHVANYLRLLQLPDDIQEDVSRGTISMGHARAIIGIKDVELQRKIVEKIKNEKLSVRQVEELVNQLGTGQEKKEKKQAKKESVPPLIKRYEELLQEVFSTSVRIRHGSKNGKVKGKIEIEYYSERELDRLIEMLNQNRVIL